MINAPDDHSALGEEIARLAGKVNVATHRLLTCVRLFDVAEGWHRQGAQSCAHWLTWRIGIDPGAAREKVRVARALGMLPAIDRVFGEGRLSYAQVRAVTRIATPENEQRVLEIALAATGAQLERICRGFRRATEADKEHAAERQVRARMLGDGLVKLEVVLSADEAELVMQALTAGRRALSGAARASEDDGQAARGRVGGPGPATSRRASAADALVHMVSAFLAHEDDGAEAPSTDGPRGEVVLHVDQDLVSDDRTLAATLGDGTRVSAETLHGWPATAAWWSRSATRKGSSWTLGGVPGPFRRPSAGRCCCGTVTAASPGAPIARFFTAITSSTGCTAAARRSTTC